MKNFVNVIQSSGEISSATYSPAGVTTRAIWEQREVVIGSEKDSGNRTHGTSFFPDWRWSSSR